MIEQQRTVWQPIETAPRDGTPILLGWLSYAGYLRRAEGSYWREPEGYWSIGVLSIGDPTHWIPMPEMPDVPAREGGVK